MTTDTSPEAGPLNSPQAQAIPAPPLQAGVKAIDSRELLQGARMVAIAHEGAVYRLQATRLGKLILTK